MNRINGHNGRDGHNDVITRLIEVESTLQNIVVPTFVEMQSQVEILRPTLMYAASNNPAIAPSINNFVNLFSSLADSMREIAQTLKEIKDLL